MATYFVRTYLPQTTQYIDSLQDQSRQGHHNWVAEQRMNNANPPVSGMTTEQLDNFDRLVRAYLERIDHQ